MKEVFSSTRDSVYLHPVEITAVDDNRSCTSAKSSKLRGNADQQQTLWSSGAIESVAKFEKK